MQKNNLWRLAFIHQRFFIFEKSLFGMQFKNPELLFALFFLLIPIIVHLFQLRRFQKTPFTNVKFLQQVTLQTRKSSKLKKWLVLFTRLFALACIILAFAQPYITAKTDAAVESETVVYIGNSLSMQAAENRGELLKTAGQELFKNQNIPDQLSWFTNNKSVQQTTAEDFKRDVLNLDYSANGLSLQEVLLKAETLFSKDLHTSKNLIWISDFQGQENFPDVSSSNMNITTVQLKPAHTNNLAIDSAYVSAIGSTNLELTVLVANYGEAVDNVPIALYKDETLVARTSTAIDANETSTAVFEIEDTDFSGSISITDQSLQFDNELFFNINQKNNIKVLSINQTSDAFLKKIYTSDEFDFVAQPLNQLDFNLIQEQNTIILNELDEINPALQNALQAFIENRGTLVIIPSNQANTDSYNSFLNLIHFGSITNLSTADKQVTTIHFTHPVYQNVFEDQVTNFQYPTVQQHFLLSRKQTPVLSFEDNLDFLMQSQNIYFFSGSLNLENSNFIHSPLVVPTFYRIAKQSLPLPNLYYTIGRHNKFAVAASLPQDHILSIRNDNTDFIPLQRNSGNSVLITTTDQPETAGIFGIYNKDTKLENISYNHSRKNSRLNYMNAASWTGTENYNSLHAAFEKLAAESNVRNFWKWFVIFALLFIAIEMFLLKRLK